MRDDRILPHLAVVGILLTDVGSAATDDTTQLTTPRETAGPIDQLRTAGITLTYDPDTRTIRTSDSNPIAVTAGRAR